jgi:hypothetical protein
MTNNLKRYIFKFYLRFDESRVHLILENMEFLQVC